MLNNSDLINMRDLYLFLLIASIVFSCTSEVIKVEEAFEVIKVEEIVPFLPLGSNFYIDSEAPGGGDGSFARPWKSSAQFNAYRTGTGFKNGDNLWFKAGSHLVATEPFRISWGGTPENRVYIGVYYKDGTFGRGNVPPEDRAIIDGNKHTVPTTYSYTGLIHARETSGYVTINDLEIRDSGGAGINVGDTNDKLNPGPLTGHFIIRNCFIYRTFRRAIEVSHTAYTLVENNRTLETSYGASFQYKNPCPWPQYSEECPKVSGAAIEITAARNQITTFHNVVRNNVVERGHYEGIGVYQGASKTIVENNIVFNCGTYHIYTGNTSDNIFRNNLVYSGPGSISYPSRGAGIFLGTETHREAMHIPIGKNHVYNNYIAGMGWGLVIGVSETSTYGYHTNQIYNNRIVDCSENFRFRRTTTGDWYDNYYYNNYSFLYSTVSGEVTHANELNPPNITFGSRLDGTFDGNWLTCNGSHCEGAHGKAVNATSGIGRNVKSMNRENTSQLIKTTGWRNLLSGEIAWEDKRLPPAYFRMVGEER